MCTKANDSAILDFLKWKFNCRYGSDGQYVTTPNFVTISQTIAEIWRFIVFNAGLLPS